MIYHLHLRLACLDPTQVLFPVFFASPRHVEDYFVNNMNFILLTQ